MMLDVTAPISPKRLRSILKKLGLSQSELARLLDVDGRTVRRWISGDNPVPGPARVAILAMAHLDDLRRIMEEG